jgi:hypothetical protein
VVERASTTKETSAEFLHGWGSTSRVTRSPIRWKEEDDEQGGASHQRRVLSGGNCLRTGDVNGSQVLAARQEVRVEYEDPFPPLNRVNAWWEEAHQRLRASAVDSAQ